MDTLIHACHNILYYEPYITLAEKLNEYTGGDKMEDGKCPKEYMAQFDDIFQKIVDPSMVAAIIMEPIQGEGGYVVPPVEWLQYVRDQNYAENDVLSKEKLFPVLAMSLYNQWEEAVEIARADLAMEGMGHSCVIHSNTAAHIEYVPTKINVSRYAVNQVGGALDNGLTPPHHPGLRRLGQQQHQREPVVVPSHERQPDLLPPDGCQNSHRRGDLGGITDFLAGTGPGFCSQKPGLCSDSNAHRLRR